MPADTADTADTAEPVSASLPSGLPRSALLRIGAALLAGGSAVHSVEQEIRLLGKASGSPDLRVSATPTGVFVSMARDEPVGFETVGPPLRFDQTAGVVDIVRDLRAGRLDPADCMAALDAVSSSASRIPAWLATAGIVPIGAGIAMVLQPAVPNVLVAGLAAAGVAVLTRVVGRFAVLGPLLPVVAAFLVGVAVLTAADAGLIQGALRTIVAPLAVLLPGALLVTGLSELAAGAMVSGASRLVYGVVQLVLFSTGVMAAVVVTGTDPATLTNIRLDELGPWAPWAAVLVIGAGVFLNVSAPPRALPWIMAVLLLTFAAQASVQGLYGVAVGGLVGAIVASVAASVIERLPRGVPAVVVFLPAFWLLVPGSLGLLGTAGAMADSSAGLQGAAEAMGAVIAVALGVLIGSAVGRAGEQWVWPRARPRRG